MKFRRKKKSARAIKKYNQMLRERKKVAKRSAEKSRDEEFYKQYASLAGGEQDLFWLNTIIEEGGTFFNIWKCEHRTADGVIWHTDYLLVISFSLVFLLLFLIESHCSCSVLFLDSGRRRVQTGSEHTCASASGKASSMSSFDLCCRHYRLQLKL